MGKYKNISLNNALRARKDEFYTQYNDIEEEIKHYSEWFKGKTVLCNCGDSVESAFFRYFVTNFNALGLSKLIAVSYSESLIGSSPAALQGSTHRAYRTVVTSVPAAHGLLPRGASCLGIQREILPTGVLLLGE